MKHDRWWFHVNSQKQIQAMAQYRMGSHWLEVERGRYANPPCPRSNRLCKYCDLHERGDELHMWKCPLFAPVHQKFGQRFASGLDWGNAEDHEVRQAMNIPGGCGAMWNDMAAFILQCKQVCMDRARAEGHLK